MCPLAQLSHPTEVDPFWTDEQIIQVLDECSCGSSVPNNVLEDSSPYQCPPAYLPEGIWYLVHPNAAKDSEFGFWEGNEEACKIYSSATISGWRTTLRYFEGKKPHGKRTNWLMQEYKITQQELLDKNKIIKDPRLLCRVFSDNTSNVEISLDCKPLIETDQINSVPSSIGDAEIGYCDDPIGDTKEQNFVVKSVPAPDKVTNDSLEVFSEQDCFSRGDFLELNDLEDPESHSSSSQNSSCPSKLSDEYFDSLALLRDLEEEDDKYMQELQSSSRYNVTSSARPNDEVMHPVSSGWLLGGSTSTPVVQASEAAVVTNSTSRSVLEHSTKRQKPESQAEGTSTSSNEATSPSSDKDTKSNGEKKASSGRMKKLKMYFCLSLF